MKTAGKLHYFYRVIQLFISIACLAAVPNLSLAQDAGADQGKSSKTADEKKAPLAADSMTIIVTAQKEPEPAISLPFSITAATDDMIRSANIQAVKQAAFYAPNVFINEFTSRAVSNPFFRGIGGSPTNPGVSTLIDGVPQLNSYSSNIEMIDVAQIEFVRRPEGTLYGRNTAGGLINITSRSQSEVWTAQAQGTFGNYSLRDLRGSISSPLLKDRFSINLAGGYSARDGYTQNDLTLHNLDSRDAGFGKAQVFFKFSDRWKMRFIVAGERDRDGDYALGDLGYIRANPHRVNRDFEGFTNRSVKSTTLQITYQGSAMDFTSITGGVWWRDHSFTDLDYQEATLANYGLFAVRDNVDHQYQFTQEFRFASGRDKSIVLGDAMNLSWQAGVFVFRQNFQQEAANDISSIFGFFPPSSSRSFADLDDWGVGVYGQARFTAWQKLDITAGLRFDHENKDASLGVSRDSSAGLSDRFSKVSPQFSVAYRFTPNQMAYVSVSRGYKAGGFNPPPTGVPAPVGTESYEAEHTWNYELGHKKRWLQDRLETNVALFYIDWKSLQLNQQIPFSGGQYYIDNAGGAFSRGVEAETRFRPSSWWDLFAMVGYTHARFLRGSRAYNANLGLNEEVAGNTLPFAPTFNANVGTQIFWAPGGSVRLYFRVQIPMVGEFQYDASNAMSQTDYELANFRGGVRGKHWFAEGWVDNAFDAHYVPIAIPYAQLGAPSGYIGESGAPMTYGARAGINF